LVSLTMKSGAIAPTESAIKKSIQELPPKSYR
jgi:hypothetical protein